MFKVENNRTIYVDDKGNVLGEVIYPDISKNVVNITHTFVDVTLRGRGIADKLLTNAFEYFKANKIKVKCSCSYAKKWVLNHEEYHNLVIK